MHSMIGGRSLVLEEEIEKSVVLGWFAGGNPDGNRRKIGNVYPLDSIGILMDPTVKNDFGSYWKIKTEGRGMVLIYIAIDDGHGVETAGKRTPLFADGTYMAENEYNAAVAGFLQKALQRCGFHTILVAPEEKDTPLSVRVKRANDAQADAYISIHANAYGTDWNEANGVESWVYDKADAKTLAFAKAIHRGLVSASGRKDRGLKKSGDLYVLKQTKMPAVLVEGGFMTNLTEAKLLLSEEYRKVCAEGICQGICNYFQIPYQAEEGGEKEMKRYQSIEDLPYGKEIMQKLVEEGVLSGDENGNLNLSEDMVRVFMILDRKDVL